MSMIKYLRTVHEKELSTTDSMILDNIEKNIGIIPETTISELSRKIFTSTTSLHRLVKKLGFDGYTDFKYSVESYLQDNSLNDDYFNTNKYLKSLLTDLQVTYKINEGKFDEVVADIMSHDNLYCFGTGWKQKQIMDNFANDILYYSKSLLSLRNIDDLQLASKQLNENSLVIIISISGDLKGYKETMTYLKEKNITTVGVSLYSDSPLAQSVTHSLQFVDSTLDNKDHHWSSIPLTFLMDQLLHYISIYNEF